MSRLKRDFAENNDKEAARKPKTSTERYKTDAATNSMLSLFTKSACHRVGKQALIGLSSQYRYFSSFKDHIVVALGGNAMLKRGEAMTIANQRKNINDGMKSLADVVNSHNVTIVHGNGPQVGLLMLESNAYEKQTGLEQISLDVLDAETEGND